MTTTTNTTTAAEVAQMLYDAERSKTPAKKSAATRALNAYVNRRVNEGSDETRTRAAITGLTNKLRNATRTNTER